MDTFTLPLELFADQNMSKLSLSAQNMLIRLYAYNFDCFTFTIKFKEPEYYGYTPGVQLHKKVIELINLGFVTVVGNATQSQKRVFAFKHKVVIDHN